ncbi:hypothetical protein BCR32DRAFT_241342 [Anaeromyces robustus]|uniref:Uncharacterized protein n=1 Tax=Anaeromyces robustus TaxID=1754192 RepID=A0A1Y1XK59_9FUNG|nr:hypothetical protein BCR32DRAFT_241342 [Anaeromyces robustus]|eukprot:ORX86083.1 hypothetical protein BCR32DRAFT_241342 [Anaeromyces robustus]
MEISDENNDENGNENENENKNRTLNKNIKENKNKGKINKSKNKNESKNENENENEINNEENKENLKRITRRNMTEIKLLEKDQKFNILNETKNLCPKINLAQLLAASPALRKELEQSLKLRVEKITCSVASTSIPIIIGKSYNTPLKVLFDTGVNINIITRKF